MKTFKKWNHKPIADYGCVCSDDYKSFCKAFKNYLKRALPECEIIGFKANHYDTSGFVKQGDKYIYVAQDLDRGRGYVDFEDTGCFRGILFRTAKDDKDYTGGHNNFSSINNLVANLNAMFNRM